VSIRNFLTLSLMATILVATVASASHAVTTIVDDDFESYADDNALYAVWEPRNGSGNAAPSAPDDGILTSDDTLFPGITGNGVDHLGGSVMQYTGLTPAAPIFPSETESIFLQSDIYVGNDGNSRTSAGLRNRTSTGNILEMGTYNANGVDPTDGVTVVPSTTYAYRLVLFGGFGGELIQQPNWLYFDFDLALDIDDSDPGTTEPTPDGIVSPVDIGAAWHTYSATITPDTVTFEIDLYRDGLDNGATLTAGSDVAGIDASVTYNITTGVQGFDSFRIGAPSGVSSANGVAFDNVSLSLVDVGGGGSDADGDGDVDGADFLKLQRDNPAGIAQWQLDYPSGALQSNLSAVPEPASLALVFFATAGLLVSRRR